jgi:tetratricopeptide (TPR) repeat protein
MERNHRERERAGVALSGFVLFGNGQKRNTPGGVVLFFMLMIWGIPVIGQHRDVLLNEAGNAWVQADYGDAAYYYAKALAHDSSDLFVAFRLAESLRHDNRYAEAFEVYQHVTTLDDARQQYPQTWFYLAMMSKQRGDYDRFCELINKFVEISEESSYKIKARHEAAMCNNGWVLPLDSAPVRITHLGRNINTPYSEFGAFQLHDSILFFSALRPISASDFQSFASFDYKSAIYSSEIKVSGYQKGEEISPKINRKNTHNANLSFDIEGKRVFYSRCTDATGGRMACNIMVAGYDKGRFQKGKKLPGKVNLDGFTNSQPHFVKFGDVGVLYFVSNRPGGYGEMDIWYAIENGGVFTEPVNCGSIINTSGNEVTPYYDLRGQRLFFSSDWHYGYGGYDVFAAKGGFGSWEKAENLGMPVNSPANDYYYSVNQNDSNGYFTSNRPGSLHMRGETCCNDIYAYEWIPQVVPELPPDLPEPLTGDSIRELARELLPLMLFFHNDEPDAATMSITSTKDYRKSLDEYVAMKALYQREYARGLRGEEATRASEDILAFFRDYVINGYEKLERLSGYLLADLEAGNTVQMLISGYCSPLSTNEYNINLARRRIHSLMLFLETTRGGALKPYLSETSEAKPKLIIFEDPVGKEKASPFVSDNPNDLRNSVFSRAAAFERRIEVSMYVSHKPGEMPLISELPMMVLSMDTMHLAPLKAGERRVVQVPYRNDGKSELMIRDVTFNGERVWVEWSNEPLLPGRERNMLMLVTAGQTLGPFIEEVTISTNLPVKSTFYVSGEVVQ